MGWLEREAKKEEALTSAYLASSIYIPSKLYDDDDINILSSFIIWRLLICRMRENQILPTHPQCSALSLHSALFSSFLIVESKTRADDENARRPFKKEIQSFHLFRLKFSTTSARHFQICHSSFTRAVEYRRLK